MDDVVQGLKEAYSQTGTAPSAAWYTLRGCRRGGHIRLRLATSKLSPATPLGKQRNSIAIITGPALEADEFYLANLLRRSSTHNARFGFFFFFRASVICRVAVEKSVLPLHRSHGGGRRSAMPTPAPARGRPPTPDGGHLDNRECSPADNWEYPWFRGGVWVSPDAR